MMQYELREDDPSINIVTRSGVLKENIKKKVEIMCRMHGLGRQVRRVLVSI